MIHFEIVGGGGEADEDRDTSPDAVVDFGHAQEAVKGKCKAKAAKTGGGDTTKAEKPKRAKKEKPVKEPRENKTETLVSMLLEANGATVAEVAKAFSWQPHTTRAAISTLPKKKQFPEGHTLSSEKVEERGGRVYRIVKV
ncbi:DUF3489 domain-containing protein [Sinorhizobium meliloti]|uniref:DUF3489 domain-containing protein n=1 Tax=Rhizobium meliloti TaxID=382 RepID=UPI000FD6FA27|nr:DUF3489 domain-containing protein [Sinorhizobium meliloti]MDE3825092.1 DUF3489 domain-containing protein [Sinorhizobium meliloti]RVM49028.1 DUF3489 domain-containing protein [Sinorhizobium meliloti]RVN68788.1 DUF3489 domain-containing protein [Sinorhizobium meliloti]